jgi:hypothetical protein
MMVSSFAHFSCQTAPYVLQIDYTPQIQGLFAPASLFEADNPLNLSMKKKTV